MQLPRDSSSFLFLRRQKRTSNMREGNPIGDPADAVSFPVGGAAIPPGPLEPYSRPSHGHRTLRGLLFDLYCSLPGLLQPERPNLPPQLGASRPPVLGPRPPVGKELVY